MPAGLNAEQQKAVAHQGGPLLIVAGPGSGKTRVIIELVYHLYGINEEERRAIEEIVGLKP
jgi:superfamily I DNA/RNA helicase